eukprot:PhM_4_TR16845/c0_g1_i1/m.58605
MVYNSSVLSHDAHNAIATSKSSFSKVTDSINKLHQRSRRRRLAQRRHEYPKEGPKEEIKHRGRLHAPVQIQQQQKSPKTKTDLTAMAMAERTFLLHKHIAGRDVHISGRRHVREQATVVPSEAATTAVPTLPSILPSLHREQAKWLDVEKNIERAAPSLSEKLTNAYHNLPKVSSKALNYNNVMSSNSSNTSGWGGGGGGGGRARAAYGPSARTNNSHGFNILCHDNTALSPRAPPPPPPPRLNPIAHPHPPTNVNHVSSSVATSIRFQSRPVDKLLLNSRPF